MITSKTLPQDCIKYQNCEIDIKFSENKREYNAQNQDKKSILGFKVDKGLINDENERCDYSLIIQNEICFLIELKGCDVSHAAEQIMKTQNVFSKKYGITKFAARIVCSKAKTAELNSYAYKKMEYFMNKQKGSVYKPVLKSTGKLVEKI